MLGLVDIKNLDEFGLIGKLEKNFELEEFLEHVKKSWDLSRLDFYSGENPEKISRVALCGGSGADFWRAAKLHKADIYLTADMKYHELIDATHSGLSIALCEHGEMERASLSKLAEKISASGLETKILDVKALTMPFRV